MFNPFDQNKRRVPVDPQSGKSRADNVESAKAVRPLTATEKAKLERWRRTVVEPHEGIPPDIEALAALEGVGAAAISPSTNDPSPAPGELGLALAGLEARLSRLETAIERINVVVYGDDD